MNFLSPQLKKPAANQAKAVVLPVACAGTTPAALAVGKGPETILQASQVLSTYDVETNTDLNDLGLLTLPLVDCPPDPQASVEEVFNQAVQHYRKNRLVAAVGGSHLISEGLVRAALEQHNGLGVLHLGAHPHAQHQGLARARAGTPGDLLAEAGHGLVLRPSGAHQAQDQVDQLVADRHAPHQPVGGNGMGALEGGQSG